MEDIRAFLARKEVAKVFFFILTLLCLLPGITPPIALIIGILFAVFFSHPFLPFNNKATRILLQISVVGLGFGMNINSALQAGKSGFLFTVVSIFFTLGIGYLIGKFLKIERKTNYLISVGTAICGGSAIAAISPIIKAEEKQISIALGTIFILNSIALIVFPLIGIQLNLSQSQFGLWCAIAIHDTSSVVGAASKFGNHALEIATTVKLARALWIIPIAFLSTFLFKNKNNRVIIPYFIGLFILAMMANSYFTIVQLYSKYLVAISRTGLTITLFLIGSGLSKEAIQTVGIKPLFLGVVLWLIISITSLWVIIKWG